MVLVVQQIRTEWTKDSRGGSEATFRNAVPEALLLPIPRAGKPIPRIICHVLRYHEGNSFDAPNEELLVDPAQPIRFGEVTVSCTKEEAHARFAWSSAAGAPDRTWARKSLVIRPGEWGRIVYNGRFGGRGVWAYHKTVVNVGLLDALAADVFTRSEPAYRFDASAILK